MSAAGSPPTVPRGARRVSLGGVALGLVLGILAVGIAALVVDIASTRSDPLALSSWPVDPMVIVVLMGIGLLVALVLAVRAIVTKEGRDLGAAATAVGLLLEGSIIFIVATVVVSNLPGM